MPSIKDIIEKKKIQKSDQMAAFVMSSIEKVVKDEISNIEQKVLEKMMSYMENHLEELVTLVTKNVSKGEKGDKPVPGVDFPLPQDGKPGYTPIKGKDYFDGKSVDADEVAEALKSKIKLPEDGYTPIKGKDYFDGKPGKDGSPDKPEEIADKLNTLESVVEQKVIKGLSRTLASIQTSIRERHGGSGGGGGMGNIVHETFALTSATTSITLSNKIAANGRALWAYYNGSFLVYDTGYTVGSDRKSLSLLFTPQDSTYLDVTYVRS